MGGSAKLLDRTGLFGLSGERTLRQNITLNAAAGGFGGIADSLARAGLFEGRLPRLGEVAETTASYAAFGGLFGGIEYAAPYSVRAFKSLWNESPTPRLQLAHSTEFQNFAETGHQPEKLASTGTARERHLPTFKEFEKVTYGSEIPLSQAALKQSSGYIDRRIVDQPFEDGVRLATSVTSKGLTAEGKPLDASERFLVIDKKNDPVLQAVLADAKARFRGIDDPHVLATGIKQYAARLFNRYNLDGPQLEQLYEEMVRRNRGHLMPLGEFVRRGSAACLPRTALMKSVGEELGLTVRLRQGFLDSGGLQAHVFPDVKLPSQEYVIYDPSQVKDDPARYFSMATPLRTAAAEPSALTLQTAVGKPTTADNPFLAEYNSIEKAHGWQDRYPNSPYRHRTGLDIMFDLKRKYAYAVPTKEALEIIADHGPIIEMAAGNGYWAWLLRQTGVKVAAFDKSPAASGKDGYFANSHTWTDVAKGSVEQIRKHPNHTLMLVWPPPNDPLALNALSQYKGNRLLYVGETGADYIGSLEFHDKLADRWTLSQYIELPTFPSYEDALHVYTRNPVSRR
jgi:hypothetical protein